MSDLCFSFFPSTFDWHYHDCLWRSINKVFELDIWWCFADWGWCLPRGPGLQSGSVGEEWQRARPAGSGQRGHQGQDLQIPPGKLIHGSLSLLQRQADFSCLLSLHILLLHTTEDVAEAEHDVRRKVHRQRPLLRDQLQCGVHSSPGRVQHFFDLTSLNSVLIEFTWLTLSSSLQGLEIVNPGAAEKKVAEANQKYFSNMAEFLKVKKESKMWIHTHTHHHPAHGQLRSTL